MKVALISLNQIWEDKDANKSLITNLLGKINNSGVDLVVFPEMTLTGFTMNSTKHAEEPFSSESIDFFKKCALEYNCAVVIGIIQKESKLPSNRMIFIDKSGCLVSSYAKIHPFSLAGELESFSKGNLLVKTYFKGINIGSTICFDLRFPELYQALSKDCDVIINIANWPAKRHVHWDTLLRARAIENQVVMIGVNRIGVDGNGIEYKKSTAVFGADGMAIMGVSVSESIDIFEFDENEVSNIRKSFPFKKDRQIEFYKEIL
jgi:predicted amidohydrolase